jgi:hypothetical protein
MVARPTDPADACCSGLGVAFGTSCFHVEAFHSSPSRRSVSAVTPPKVTVLATMSGSQKSGSEAIWSHNWSSTWA